MAPTRVPILSAYRKGYERQIIGWRDTSPPLEDVTVINYSLTMSPDDGNDLLMTLDELLNDSVVEKRPLRDPRPPCPGLFNLGNKPKKIRIVIDLTVNHEVIDLTK